MAYASLIDLVNLGLPAAALANFADNVKLAHLEAASSEADGYIQKRWAIPLSSWPKSLTMRVARMAAYTLLEVRGFNPANPADATVVKGYDDAIKWLEKVATGAIEPAFVDASPATDEAAPLFSGELPQAWLSPSNTPVEVFDLPEDS